MKPHKHNAKKYYGVSLPELNKKAQSKENEKRSKEVDCLVPKNFQKDVEVTVNLIDPPPSTAINGCTCNPSPIVECPVHEKPEHECDHPWKFWFILLFLAIFGCSYSWQWYYWGKKFEAIEIRPINIMRSYKNEWTIWRDKFDQCQSILTDAQKDYRKMLREGCRP